MVVSLSFFLLVLSGVSYAFHRQVRIAIHTQRSNHGLQMMQSTDLQPVSTISQRRDSLIKFCRITGSIATGFVLKRSIESAQAIDLKLPECSDSIVVFQNAQGREIVMIGTAHISEQSVDLVRRTIQSIKPDTVMIELDRKRIGKVSKEQSLKQLGFILPADQMQEGGAAPSTNRIQRENVFDQVKGFVGSMFISAAQNAAGAVLGKALSQFYNSVEKLGFTAGGEFKAAVEEAKATGAVVLLGDRDVDITLQRLATAISECDESQVAALIDKLSTAEEQLGLTLTENIDKESMSKFVEGMKRRDTVSQMMGIIKTEVPGIYSALIGERDQYMANSVATAQSDKLVGVVGLAHIQGIEQYLNSYGFKTIKRNCPAQQAPAPAIVR